MTNKVFFLLGISCLLLCVSTQAQSDVKGFDHYTDAQIQPIDQPTSSFQNGEPKIEFEEQFHDFGQIEKGEKPRHTFTFHNRGKAPLMIDMASACECTELDWTRSLVYPGEEGHILATYDSTEKEGEQEVAIDVIAYKMLPGQKEPKEDDIIISQARFRVFVKDSGGR